MLNNLIIGSEHQHEICCDGIITEAILTLSLEIKMNIEKDKVVVVLDYLMKDFPGTVTDWAPIQNAIGSEIDLVGYLVYLKDQNYIEGNFTFYPLRWEKPWEIALSSVRINAAGIDHLHDMSPSPSGWIRR
ncbi:hypothetical protein FBY13_11951 [Pantoea sp. SJZ147]|nr:hypothetical protein FBY13_11951 [Pantoea sp. SJZ147]